jgi:hypothetical protein
MTELPNLQYSSPTAMGLCTTDDGPTAFSLEDLFSARFATDSATVDMDMDAGADVGTNAVLAALFAASPDLAVAEKAIDCSWNEINASSATPSDAAAGRPTTPSALFCTFDFPLTDLPDINCLTRDFPSAMLSEENATDGDQRVPLPFLPGTPTLTTTTMSYEDATRTPQLHPTAGNGFPSYPLRDDVDRMFIMAKDRTVCPPLSVPEEPHFVAASFPSVLLSPATCDFLSAGPTFSHLSQCTNNYSDQPTTTGNPATGMFETVSMALPGSSTVPAPTTPVPVARPLRKRAPKQAVPLEKRDALYYAKRAKNTALAMKNRREQQQHARQEKQRMSALATRTSQLREQVNSLRYRKAQLVEAMRHRAAVAAC